MKADTQSKREYVVNMQSYGRYKVIVDTQSKSKSKSKRGYAAGPRVDTRRKRGYALGNWIRTQSEYAVKQWIRNQKVDPHLYSG